jgi:short-subunit dehydrogenase
MEAVNDALRREVEPLGVKVVVVIPGAIRSGMTASGLSTATRLAGAMTPDQHARYDSLMRAYRATVTSFEANGLPPDRAAAVITTALTAESRAPGTPSDAMPR